MLEDIKEFKRILNDYLLSWQECIKCNDMIRLELMSSTNEDELICLDCEKDENSFIGG